MSPRWDYLDGETSRSADVAPEASAIRVRLDDDTEFDCRPAGADTVDVTVDGRRRRAWVLRRDGERLVFLDGVVHTFRRPMEDDDETADAAAAGGPRVCADMPGTVVKILVGEGAEVAAGDPLVIMEAMKMETELKSPLDGVVREIAAVEGAVVAQDDLLIVLEPSTGEDGGGAS